MKSLMLATAMLLAVPTTMAVATDGAQAQRWDRDRDRDRDRGRDRWDRGDRGWHGDRNDGWDPSRHYADGRYRERRLGRSDRVYRGGDGRYYCRRDNGTTGLVIGALGGALAGNALGGDTLGTLLGAGGGALLGRSIDRGNIRCR